MIPIPIPQDKHAIILVQLGRCIVSRYRYVGPYTYSLEEAVNWRELEDDTRAAVEDAQGAITECGHFVCKDELSARAIWPDE